MFWFLKKSGNKFPFVMDKSTQWSKWSFSNRHQTASKRDQSLAFPTLTHWHVENYMVTGHYWGATSFWLHCKPISLSLAWFSHLIDTVSTTLQSATWKRSLVLSRTITTQPCSTAAVRQYAATWIRIRQPKRAKQTTGTQQAAAD